MPQTELAQSRLLEFSRQLHSVYDYEGLLVALAGEVKESIGYNAAWITVYNAERRTIKSMTPMGTDVGDIWDDAVELPIDGDAFVTEVIEERRAVIIEDAQTDSRVNREVVEAIGSRTIVAIPMLLIDAPFGALSVGSFGEEGVRLPPPEAVEYLHELANIVALASARILLARERESSIRHQADTAKLLADRQRIESMGEIAGGVAHDFNNMITVIQGAAQILRSELDKPEQFANLRMIENASESAAELAKQLLALGKRQELAAEPTDVVDRVRAIAEMLGRVLGAGVVVELATEPGLPKVFVDRRHLEQVLMNLGLNARDAMPDGGTLAITVTEDEIDEEYVADHPWSKPGRYVRIIVADDGVGMDAETLEHIFDPFFTTRTDTGGTGLGLSVTRAIVEQHGGLVRASSKPGSGSAISVYLPALPDA